MNHWMGKPVRLQLKRAKGFNLQVESVSRNGRQAVNCARPGPYGNPHVVSAELSAMQACALFHRDLKQGGAIKGRRIVPVAEIREKLAGKNLACFCPPGAKWCHVDTLLEVANGN